jgi:hypothetical protein
VNLYTDDVEPSPRGRREQRLTEYFALWNQVEARILAICAERGMTPEDLRWSANVRFQAWYKRGAFIYDFKLSQLCRIAKALGVPVTELLA